MNVTPLLYDDERSGDFCINLKNGNLIACHKAVLIAASQLFAAELTHKSIEGDLPFDDEIVTFCIQFIYGMKIPWDDINLATAVQIYRCVAHLRLIESPPCTQPRKLCENLNACEIISECVKVDINREPFFEIAADILTNPCGFDIYDIPESLDSYAVDQFIQIGNLEPEIFTLFDQFLADNEFTTTSAVLHYVHNGKLSRGDSRYFTCLSDVHKQVLLSIADKSDTEFILAIINRAEIKREDNMINGL